MTFFSQQIRTYHSTTIYTSLYHCLRTFASADTHISHHTNSLFAFFSSSYLSIISLRRPSRVGCPPVLESGRPDSNRSLKDPALYGCKSPPALAAGLVPAPTRSSTTWAAPPQNGTGCPGRPPPPSTSRCTHTCGFGRHSAVWGAACPCGPATPWCCGATSAKRAPRLVACRIH